MLATFLKGAKVVAAPAAGIQYVGGYVDGFAGTTSNVTVPLTSLTGGLASAPAAGDLVVVYFGTGSTVNRNLVISGYNLIADLFAGSVYDTNLETAYKFMGATPDTSFTLTGGTLSTSDAGAVAVQVWRGVDQTTPFDVTLTASTGTNTVLCDPAAITPVTPGAVIIAGGAGAHNNGVGSSGIRTYSSSDLTAFLSTGQNNTNQVTIGLGYHVWTSGSFNPAQFTFSGTNSTNFSYVSVTLALRPA